MCRGVSKILGSDQERRGISARLLVLTLALVSLVVALASCGDDTPPPTPTPALLKAESPVARTLPTFTPTATATATLTPTPTLTPSPTATPTPFATWTPYPSATPVPATSTPRPPAATFTPAPTPSQTPTPVPPSPTPTASATATPTAMATPTFTPTPSPTPTATPTPTITPTPTATATPTATPTPTPTFTPTPTRVPGRDDLYELAAAPEHMASMWWKWRGQDTFEKLTIDFTIHNDTELRGRHGLYFMAAYSWISDVPFYFGLQTDVHSPEPPRRRGKGLIFSRWDTRDLALARWHDTEGWNQSSGHEGDFIGVRRSYDWGAGEYRFQLAPDGEAEADGRWFGVWITDKATGVETWAGSLKFPMVNRKAEIRDSTYSTLEVYGSPIRPIDIPEWHVSIEPHQGDGRKADAGTVDYSWIHGEIMNSDVSYHRGRGVVDFRVGGLTERRGPEKAVLFR